MVKTTSVYFLILLLLLQFIPLQPNATYASELPEPKKALVFAEEAGGTVDLYEEESLDSKVLLSLEDETEVTVLEEGLEFTFLEYTDVETKTSLNGYVQSSMIVDSSNAEEFRNSRLNSAESSITEPEASINESIESNEEDNDVTEEESVKNEDGMIVDENQFVTDVTEETLEGDQQETLDVSSSDEESSEVNAEAEPTSLNLMTQSAPVNLQGIGLASPTTHVYEQPSTSSEPLKSYDQGTLLKYETYTADWHKAKVYINGQATTGYIKVSDVENITSESIPLNGVSLKEPTNIYSKASSNSNVLKTYPQGSVLKYRTLTSDWYEATVYIKGKATTGYIHKSDVENITNNPVTYIGVGKTSPTKVYQRASTSSNTLKSYEQGSILKYESFVSGWYLATVYINGKKTLGYIKASDVENPTENPETYYGVGLQSPTKIYEKAITSSEVLKSYNRGSVLKYQSYINGWYSATVYINGHKKTGYIKSGDVENSTSSPTNLQVWGIADKVNVYSSASEDAAVLKYYNSGAELKVQTFTTSWYKATVYINGYKKTGYIHKDDVSTEKVGYLELDLRKPANISAKDIEDFFDRKGHSNSQLKKHSQSFINVQNKYGVNAVYLVAHAIWETGWAGSNLFTYKNNLYGYGAYDVAPFTMGYYFDSIEESINAVAYMVKKNYLIPGGSYYYSEHGSTLTGMNVKYATDQNWKNGIANLMEGIQPYDAKYYPSASPITPNGSAPENLGRDIPAGKPVPTDIVIDFPQGITATLNGNINLRSYPYLSSSFYISTLQKSTKVTVLGYNTDVRTTGDYPYDHRWYRISVDGQTGWIYGESLSFDNLLQVSGLSTTLNIRNQPEGDKIGYAKANEFLKAVLENGQPVTDSGWYNIYLPNSSETGWVSGEYITELEN
ncbi:SH3 domain-containing protein [Bacillus sp. V3B]|uniref:SH3 domain-containing protein n=1 Tax=Bacillus sp. V3B TaxID=2804915 RepID=UPI00210D7694|nr:SH3 domain-containing protein [Bacillus sp. V3B]